MKTKELIARGQKRLDIDQGEIWSIQSGRRRRFYLIYKKRSKLTNKELKYTDVIEILIWRSTE